MREPFRKARVYITSLLVIEIILGALIIITTGIYHHILATYLANTERQMLTGQLFNTYLLGFQVVSTYLGSVFMWNSLWIRRCSPNICLLLSVWIFFTFLITVCACATMWTLYMCASAIHATAEVSLIKGIDLYYICPEWKLLWDGLQFYRECCGVHGYMDWMKASWMPNDAVIADSSTEPCAERKTTALAPYACCKHSCNACFENYIPRYGNTGIPFLNLTQINTNGCLPLFEASMWECIELLMIFVLFSIFIDLIMCCLTKVVINYQRSHGCCESFEPEELGDDDDEHPILIADDSKDSCEMLSQGRQNIKTKIDHRLVNKTNLTHKPIDCRTRKDIISESEAERRASIRAEMEMEKERRASIRSEMEAEEERRASIRARMDAERRSFMRPQWNEQQMPPRRSDWNRSTDVNQERRQSTRPTHTDACANGINCSGCTQVRNLDSGESRFVH